MHCTGKWKEAFLEEGMDKMNNPIYVTRPFLPPREEYDHYLDQIWQSGVITNAGPLHNQLEEQLRKYLNVPYAMLFTNGHLSLEFLIQAAGLTGEVITTPFTFASTVHAIVRNGLTPVFCDISEDDYTMDTSKIEELITDKTSAILPVHVYGNPCDVESIRKIARKHSLKVIYDAAHAFGEEVNGIGIGNYGDGSIFSFHATKVFQTIEGGAAVVKDMETGYKLYQLKNFGITGETTISSIGANAKMNEFQAAMGLCNLKHVEELITGRRNIVQRYEENLKDVAGIRLNRRKENIKYNYAYFPVLVEEGFGADRDKVCEVLNKEQIYPRKYFYPLINHCRCYRERFDPGLTPVAEYISDNIITLPLYPQLSMEDVDRICELLKACR